MNSSEPSSYPRRILLVVSGMSPQIMTETLYALTQTRTPAYLPTEVHILTTSSGASNARKSLLQGDAHFLQLCSEYDLEPAMLNEERIHCIKTPDGEPLEDIRTVEENEFAADCITEFIRKFTADENASLHVSIAGGRKTMGYYAGYALSLYGRVQDRLSHVLVTQGYEGHPEFYYPPRTSRLITSGVRELDAKNAEVMLAEIPFVRLRQDIPERLLQGHATFGETIAQAQLAQEPQRVFIDLENLVFKVGEISLNELGGKNLAFFIWLLQRDRDGNSTTTARDFHKVKFCEDMGKEFAELCRKLSARDEHLKVHRSNHRRVFPRFDEVIESVERGLDMDSFWYRRADLNKALCKVLGGALARGFILNASGKKGESTVYSFSISDEIEWRPFRSC